MTISPLGLTDVQNPVVLNLANAYAPGGGFLYGDTAQEEELSRCSTLYHAIGDNTRLAQGGIYLSPIPKKSVLYSPDVQFFRGRRDEGYPFFESPKHFAVISAAAYNLQQGKEDPDLKTYIEDTKETIKEDTKETIKNILRCAAAEGHDAIVLGALTVSLELI